MYFTSSTLLRSGLALSGVTVFVLFPDGFGLELFRDPAVALAEALFGEKGKIFRVAVRVAGKREHVGERALAGALVADDGSHVEVNRDLAIEPNIVNVRIGGLADVHVR